MLVFVINDTKTFYGGLKMEKIQNLKDTLKENSIDLTLITDPENIFYFSEFLSHPYERFFSLIVFSDSDPVIICPAMEVLDAKSSNFSYDVVGISDTDNTWEIVKNTVLSRTKNVSTIALEKNHLNLTRYESLVELFPTSEFTEVDTIINSLRLIKTEEELNYLRQASKIADLAIQVGCENLKEGISELELLNIIESFVKSKGYSMSFKTIVLFGEKTASPHGIAGEKKLQKGDMVLFDLGVIVNGYCSDITRTFAFDSISDEKRQIYNTVLHSINHATSHVKPGVKAKELDYAARSIIEDAGYGKYFTHRVGHGLGISVHEFPSLHAENEMELLEGMVITIEPGIYIPNLTGVRIEDDVYITSNGAEILTKSPKELIIIPSDK